MNVTLEAVMLFSCTYTGTGSVLHLCCFPTYQEAVYTCCVVPPHIPGDMVHLLCCSLMYREEYSLTNAAFLIIRGCPVAADVATVETHDGGKCYMSLAMAWGLVADVDIESEKLRSLGETRFVLGQSF